MFDLPKTLDEARMYRYHQWAGNPYGFKYQEGKCAFEVWRNYDCYQCRRKNGYGPEKLYCKQHSKKIL